MQFQLISETLAVTFIVPRVFSLMRDITFSPRSFGEVANTGNGVEWPKGIRESLLFLFSLKLEMLKERWEISLLDGSNYFDIFKNNLT